MTSPMLPTGAGAPPGPADRVAFFDEQRRNRRATWRLAAAAALGVALMGIPVSIVVTPLVYGALLIGGHIVNIFYPFPATVTQGLVSEVRLLSSTIEQVTGSTQAARPSIPALLFVAAALELPGVMVMIASWLGVRALLRRAGVGGMLLSLGARPPRSDDLEERELQNTVEEMAIAAGLAPPRVALLDSERANAAVIGTSEGDATVVASRGLLDGLSRSEIQAVVGHLIGSMGNGDLKIAFTVVSVFEACGLLVTLLDAPFGPTSRENLGRLVQLALHRREATATAEADLVGSILAARVALEGDDDVLGSHKEPSFVLLPLILINVAAKWTLFIFTSVLVGPILALLWRARRYLADATAVQLTRNPDALASALGRLTLDGGAVLGGQSASYLFIVGQRSATRAGDSGQKDRLGTNSLIAFHPPVKRRLTRLVALGASANAAPRDAPRRASTPQARAVYGIILLLVGAAGALALAAAFAAVVILVVVSMFFASLALFAIHAAFLVLGYLLKTFGGR